MAKLLFVVPPLTGHINPLLAVAEELQLAGHHIAWAGEEEVLAQHLTDDVQIFSLPSILSEELEEQTKRVRGLDSIRFFYEAFCLPLAAICVEPLEAIVNHYKPDLLVCDHQMLAGALVAKKLNIKWVSTMSTSASILQPPDMLTEWLLERLISLQGGAGLQPQPGRMDFSPYACLVFSSQALIGEDAELIPAPYHFVGPVISQNRRSIDFPWHQLQKDKKKILITLGTVSWDRNLKFYQVMQEALADEDVQVVMVAPESLRETLPANFILCEKVPQLELLPFMDLVVSHAGHNTVCETLIEGIPMVLAPIRDDQPVVARQVVNTGAGKTIRYGKITVNTAKKVISDVMNTLSYKQNAMRLSQELKKLQGAPHARAVIDDVLVRDSEQYASTTH